MYLITAKVEDINTKEGRYKNILIAEKHKRRLEKKYPGTTFKIERTSKEEDSFNDFYAVEKIFGGKEETKSDKSGATAGANR